MTLGLPPGASSSTSLFLASCYLEWRVMFLFRAAMVLHGKRTQTISRTLSKLIKEALLPTCAAMHTWLLCSLDRDDDCYWYTTEVLALISSGWFDADILCRFKGNTCFSLVNFARKKLQGFHTDHDFLANFLCSTKLLIPSASSLRIGFPIYFAKELFGA